MEKRVIVITGASGAGKTTVGDLLAKQYQVPKVITHTTRAPRAGEIDGKDYYFETLETFKQNNSLEHVTYSGNQYGSSYEGLQRGWENSDFVSIVLDTAGAVTYYRELGEQAIILFVTISDVDQLRERLVARGDEREAVIARTSSKDFERDLTLPSELKDVAYTIVNDHWEHTEQVVDQLMTEFKNQK